MECPKCGKKMEIRSGKFGDFYYCPNQYAGCTQKTISISKTATNTYKADVTDDFHTRERLRTIKSLSCNNQNSYGMTEEYDCYSDPDEYSGFWDNSGDWFRPY